MGIGWVEWKGEQHMLDRHGITTDMADEAINDIDALVFDPDPRSRSGESLRVIGYSETARAVLAVIIVRHEGNLYGATSHPANNTERRLYQERTES